MKFKIGELIKWYELYGDIGVVKNSGLGVLLSVREISFGKEKNYIYKIHTLKEQKNMFLEEYYIESINLEGKDYEKKYKMA